MSIKTEDVIPDVPGMMLCKSGLHDLTIEGYKVMSDGRKRCRACFREAKRRNKQRGGSNGRAS